MIPSLSGNFVTRAGNRVPIPDALKYKSHSRTKVFLNRKLLINTIYNNTYTRNPQLRKMRIYTYFTFVGICVHCSILANETYVDSSKRMCCVRCQIVLKNDRFFGKKWLKHIWKITAAQIKLKMEKLYNFTP